MEELSTIPTPCTTKIQALRDSIAQIIVGQTQATDLLLTSVIARGHVLIEGVPGVAKTLLARENVTAYYLEFDDARSGGFEPLAAVSGEKKVVLGLVTTKRPELEDKAAVIARIHDAAKYIPLDRLCLSPQCGFASCEIGNKLTEAQQWAKLALVKEIAEEVWG